MAESHRISKTAIREGRGRLSAGAVVLLLGLALLVASSGCQEQSASTQRPVTTSGTDKPVEMSAVAPASGAQAQRVATEAPALTLEKTAHDFGEIGPGTSHTAKFEFKNTGTAPLIVTQVRTCCGVVAKGVKNGQKYAPGRGGTLEIEYQAALVPGDMKRNLYMYCNDPAKGIVPLTIQAKIMKRIEVEPANLTLFLKRDNAGAKDIKLTSLDGRPFKITSFKATADSISADFDPDVEATEFVLKPKADLQKLERYLRGQIRIALTHPECPEVAVLYDVVPEFTVTPPQLIVFDLKRGQTTQREVWILGNYEEDFEIESVKSQKGILELVERKKVEGAARNWVLTPTEERTVTRHQLKIDITPPVDDDSVVLKDVLEVKVEGGETILIPFQGYFVGN